MRGQIRPGVGHMTPSACVRAEPHGCSAERISAQTQSKASKGNARNRMTPYRFQRFLVLCRCYAGAAGAFCARPGASWWPPNEFVGMGSRRAPMAAPLRESPPRRNRKHRRENAENRMTPHRFQRFLVLCRCYSGAAGACCARPGASLWRPHDSFSMGTRWAPWSLRRKDFRPDALRSIESE